MTVVIDKNSITIPQKIEKKIKNFSRNLGISKRNLLINAVSYYLKNLEQKIELKKELELWEKISNKDFIEFEKGI